MDQHQRSTIGPIKKSQDAPQDKDTRVADAATGNSRLRTFYRFRDQPTASGVKSVIEKASNHTAITVLVDWGILHEEVVPLVAIARTEPVSVKIARDIAPNLAHWAGDNGIKRLLDMCSPSGDDYSANTMSLDRLGRRKNIPVTDFLDTVVACRLGKTVETIRSYRQRGARVSPQKMG